MPDFQFFSDFIFTNGLSLGIRTIKQSAVNLWLYISHICHICKIHRIYMPWKDQLYGIIISAIKLLGCIKQIVSTKSMTRWYWVHVAHMYSYISSTVSLFITMCEVVQIYHMYVCITHFNVFCCLLMWVLQWIHFKAVRLYLCD